ncbi:uncharacterized protein E0L32_005716 [Thyridium curvatum]|uniref:Methyltransferase n=1 Tax=Thyridium curvatum TaxID=1093900 RepID=A0A507AUY6_9PEZI|nr:uncharacterized protein E0L32_005716 [Thyridium curvatum]TPX13772.1 hypothetical protein E0L32_005716 [Thyridium curvatum]
MPPDELRLQDPARGAAMQSHGPAYRRGAGENGAAAPNGGGVVVRFAPSPVYDEDNDTDMTSVADGEENDEAVGLEVDEDEQGSVVEDSRESKYAVSNYPSLSSRYASGNRFDANTVVSSSRSIYDDELDYVWENGRRYCGSYSFPNDDLEQDRMRVVHQVYLNVFDLELTTVPLEDPKYILDIGTGTGEWAIGMAEMFPDCEVVGVDTSAIQPTAVPHNVFFEIDDCEMDWMRPENSCDMVHLRNMSGAFADWSFIYQQAFHCLKPGGYIEVLDYYDHRGSRNFYDAFPPDSELHLIARDLWQAGLKEGRMRGVFHMEPKLFADAGFVDIDVKEYSIPLSPIDNSLGKLWLIACLAALEAGTLRPLTKYMGWDPDNTVQILDRVVEQFKNLALDPEKGKDFKVNLKVVVARKPLVPGHCTTRNIAENGSMDYSGDDSTIG